MPPDLAALRARVRAIETASGPETAACLATGAATLDAALGGGLPLGAASEIAPASTLDEPAAVAFALGLAARALAERAGDLVIVEDGAHAREWGRVYGPGLEALGVPARRILIVSAPDPRRAHACLEDCARTGGLAATLALLGPRSGLSLAGARRVQLAVEGARGLVLVASSLRTEAFAPARVRLRVAAAPARDPDGVLDLGAGLPLMGPPAFAAILERARLPVPPRRFDLEFDHATHRFREPAALVDRPAAADRAAG